MATCYGPQTFLSHLILRWAGEFNKGKRSLHGTSWNSGIRPKPRGWRTACHHDWDPAAVGESLTGWKASPHFSICRFGVSWPLCKILTRSANSQFLWAAIRYEEPLREPPPQVADRDGGKNKEIPPSTPRGRCSFWPYLGPAILCHLQADLRSFSTALCLVSLHSFQSVHPYLRMLQAGRTRRPLFPSLADTGRKSLADANEDAVRVNSAVGMNSSGMVQKPVVLRFKTSNYM